jgi:hypothetical protein
LVDLTIIVNLTVGAVAVFVATDVDSFMRTSLFLRLFEMAITVSTLTYLLISVERSVGYWPLFWSFD